MPLALKKNDRTGRNKLKPTWLLPDRVGSFSAPDLPHVQLPCDLDCRRYAECSDLRYAGAPVCRPPPRSSRPRHHTPMPSNTISTVSRQRTATVNAIDASHQPSPRPRQQTDDERRGRERLGQVARKCHDQRRGGRERQTPPRRSTVLPRPHRSRPANGNEREHVHEHKGEGRRVRETPRARTTRWRVVRCVVDGTAGCPG